MKKFRGETSFWWYKSSVVMFKKKQKQWGEETAATAMITPGAHHGFFMFHSDVPGVLVDMVYS